MKPLETLSEERVKEEAERCLLCYDPPCSKACPHKCEPANFVRSLFFDNHRGALKNVCCTQASLKCAVECEGRYCEKACIRGKLDRPVEIHMIHESLAKEAEGREG